MADIEPGFSGRPFVGVSVVCKENSYVSYKQIECSSDRIVCVGIYDSDDTLIQTVCSVYMPFYKQGDKKQMDDFINTVDIMQSIVDTHGMKAPIKLCGDFNTQLPCKQVLGNRWHTGKGFTCHSKILYDFLISNDLIVADFMFSQPVKFTYFSHQCKHYTWINHVFTNSYELEQFEMCSIIREDSGNTSDHLPIRFKFKIKRPKISRDRNTILASKVPITCWNNREQTVQLKNILRIKIESMSILDKLSRPSSADEAQQMINGYITSINGVIHQAASDLGLK